MAFEAVGLKSPGYGLAATVVTLAYLWLPYMVLPIYAGLERLPDSLLEASADLGGRTDPDTAAGRPADGRPRDGGRLDLHLLAVAGRLHRRADRRRHQPDARQRGLRQRRCGQQPAVRGRGRHHSGHRDVGYLAAVRRTGALESL